MEKMLLKRLRILNPHADKFDENKLYDILIESDRIEKIAESGTIKSEDAKLYDFDGRIASPGFIDTHSHFREPGFEYKEDIITGAKAAARGGYTSCILMANTKPVVDNEKVLSYVINRGKEACISIYSAANITRGMLGKELSDFQELKKAGAKVLTDDGKPITDENLMRSAMEKSVKEGMILSMHEEDPAYIKEQGINEGKTAKSLGLIGASSEAEYLMVARDIRLAEKTGATIVIQHVSAKESVDMVREAKRRGLKVYAEATPHHFSMNEADLIGLNGLGKMTLAKVNPPIRTEEDRMAIINGLKDGTIDVIATDHAPHSISDKDRPFTLAPSGMIGLETAFSLAVTNLVTPGYLSLRELIIKLVYNPYEIYGVGSCKIEEGGVSDITVFDENESVTYTNFLSKSQNSPFDGKTLRGKILMTVAKGKIAYESY